MTASLSISASSILAMATDEDITRCYRKYLNREPDLSGFQDWQKAISAGMTVDTLQSHLIGSTEFHERPAEAQLEALANLGTGSPRAFSLDEIETVKAALYVPSFQNEVKAGTFRLPDGFDTTLNPQSQDYRDQQLQLWSLITKRESYNADIDEDTPEIGALDAIFRPAFYNLGDTAMAGEHLMALGHILRLSELKSGARVLEYGAGFGQIALAFARSGIKVDTVDINPQFCAAVASLARRYLVDLSSHVGRFGDNPAGADGAYDLIYFYESFHHCFDFEAVIPRLGKMLKPGGKIIMAGEPVLAEPTPLLPYDWGLRLDGENVTIMRERGWMELGFKEEFLLDKFKALGFSGEKRVIEGFHYPTAYVFNRTSD